MKKFGFWVLGLSLVSSAALANGFEDKVNFSYNSVTDKFHLTGGIPFQLGGSVIEKRCDFDVTLAVNEKAKEFVCPDRSGFQSYSNYIVRAKFRITPSTTQEGKYVFTRNTTQISIPQGMPPAGGYGTSTSPYNAVEYPSYFYITK